MIKFYEYFQTDFGAMTASDWVGLAMTVVTFILLAATYAYVFHPKNGERLNSYGNIPLNDDRFEREEKK